MPALNPVLRTVRLDVFQNRGVQLRVRNRLFFQYTSGLSTGADLTTWLTTVDTAWNTNIAPLMDTTSTLFQSQATDLSANNAPQVLRTNSRVGTRAGVALPAAVAAIVKMKIGRRYRGGHPRFYGLFGVGADVGSATSWAAAFTTAVQSGFAAFIAAVVAAPPVSMPGLQHVNVSYFQSFTVVAPPGKRAHNIPTQRPVPVTDPVLSYSVNPLIGSQRRRNAQSP